MDWTGLLLVLDLVLKMLRAVAGVVCKKKLLGSKGCTLSKYIICAGEKYRHADYICKT